jgi:hypothetical protein
MRILLGAKIMKFSGHSKTLFVMVILLVFSQFCFSMAAPQSYSELLKEGLRQSGGGRAGGYRLYSPVAEFRPGWRVFRNFEGLCEKEAVPFLVDVITNGPDWPTEEFRGYRRLLAPHVGRCYAVLCLASTRDRQAYPVLTNLLQNGAYLGDPNILQEAESDIPANARRSPPGLRPSSPSVPRTTTINLYRLNAGIKKHDIRVYAATGLGILGDPNAVGLLVEALNSDSPRIRRMSFLALARLGDMRATEAMIKQAGNDEAVDQPTFNFGMRHFTRIGFYEIWSHNKHDEQVVQYRDFPELGTILGSQNPQRKVWQHWFKVGRKWTKQQCESKHSNWKEAKKTHPQQELIKKRARDLARPGIAALPYLIDKIAAGETELIELVSGLTRGKIKEDAKQADVLEWWNKNKASWIIPFED